MNTSIESLQILCHVFVQYVFLLLFPKIDTNGKPHKEKLMGLIIDHMPKVVHEDLNKKVATCLLPNMSMSYLHYHNIDNFSLLPFLRCR